jgi:hypothetical protein
MQALCLATSLIGMRFEDFLSKGGRILDVEGDSEWDLRAVMAVFGRTRSPTPRKHTTLARHR